MPEFQFFFSGGEQSDICPDWSAATTNVAPDTGPMRHKIAFDELDESYQLALTATFRSEERKTTKKLNENEFLLIHGTWFHLTGGFI